MINQGGCIGPLQRSYHVTHKSEIHLTKWKLPPICITVPHSLPLPGNRIERVHPVFFSLRNRIGSLFFKKKNLLLHFYLFIYVWLFSVCFEQNSVLLGDHPRIQTIPVCSGILLVSQVLRKPPVTHCSSRLSTKKSLSWALQSAKVGTQKQELTMTPHARYTLLRNRPGYKKHNAFYIQSW